MPKRKSCVELSPLARDIVDGLNEAAAHFRGEKKLTEKRFEIPDDVERLPQAVKEELFSR